MDDPTEHSSDTPETPDKGSGGLTDSRMGNLIAAAGNPFATSHPSGSRAWDPPTVDSLQKSLPQYQVTAFVARGGMGAVYRGVQSALNRPIAIKVLPPRNDDLDLQFSARFKQEAEAMAALSHPNIVAVFDAGKTDDGLLYFVMEFVEGSDVARLIENLGRVPPGQALDITLGVCDALAFAHEHGIIHRDIKPSNVMIDARGRVKVADFGLAKVVDIESTLLTGSHVAMGTPDFIAPEALVPGAKVDQRADLYAVGVMLYQMLTGVIPRGRFAPPGEIVPGLGRKFDRVVDKALQTDRTRRFANAMEMRNVAERVLPRESTDGNTNQRRHPAKALALLAVAVTLLLGIFAFFLTRGDTKSSFSSPIGRWTKVLTQPEQFPADWKEPGKMSVKDGWIIDGNRTLAWFTGRGNLGPNHGIRATFRHTGIAASLMVRRQSQPNGEFKQYEVLSSNSCNIRYLERVPQESSFVLANTSSRHSPAKDEKYTLELISIGQRIFAKCNGVLAVATDSRLASGVAGFWMDGESVRDIEVINLEGVPEAEALRMAGLSGQSHTSPNIPPQYDAGKPMGKSQTTPIATDPAALKARLDAVPWTKVDLAAKPTPAYTSFPAEASVVFQDGRLLIKGGYYMLLARDAKDIAVRLRLRTGRNRLSVDLRAKADDKRLTTDVEPQSSRIRTSVFDGSAKSPLTSLPLNAASGAPTTLEVFAIGNTVGFVADGEFTSAAAPPEMLHAGNAQIWGVEVSIESIEYKIIDDSVGPKPADGKFAGSPFVNSLGMKFAPVPITGGPTDGEKVLFSIWETRVQDYEAFVKDTHRERQQAPFSQGPTHPAVMVSWDDARAFCQWLTAQEHKSGALKTDEAYRLPSDHEWSCAVGIGTLENPNLPPEEKSGGLTSEFPWGAGWPPPAGAGNYRGREVTEANASGAQGIMSGFRDSAPLTEPVGETTANRLGLYDLGGNAYEWCEDPPGPQKTTRVARGASFGQGARQEALSSHRIDRAADYHSRALGFRVVIGKISGAGADSFASEPAADGRQTSITNSLGMQFVPVAITGGPSEKQKVLFSIWETRVQDYDAFAKEKGRPWPKPGFAQGPTHPAVNLTWDDAHAFCDWLTEREQRAGQLKPGERYRLPTDHEWSCAAGIGSRENPDQLPVEKDIRFLDVYPWGSIWPPPANTLNMAGEELKETFEGHRMNIASPPVDGYRDDYVYTAPVGSFPPTQNGLHDLDGNVSEWCEDWVDSTRKRRVLRGGDWSDGKRTSFRMSKRHSNIPDPRSHCYGLRVVLSTQ